MSCTKRRKGSGCVWGATALATCDYLQPGLFQNQPLTAPLRFAFETIYVDPNLKENLSVDGLLMRMLSEDKSSTLSKPQRRKLHRGIMMHHRMIDGGNLRPGIQFKSDLVNLPGFVTGTLLEGIAHDLKLPIHALNIFLNVEQITDHTFQISTNLGQILKKNDEQLHQIVKSRFFQIPSTILQVQRMEAVEAIAGLDANEAHILARRMDFLSKSILEADTRNSLTRILNLTNMPKIQVDAKFDLEKIIALSASDDAILFRDWLHSKSNALSDDEILELTKNWKRRLGETLSVERNTNWRWLVSNGVGIAMDLVMPGASLGLSVFDQFLLKKLPSMGPIGFIEHEYRRYVFSQQG